MERDVFTVDVAAWQWVDLRLMRLCGFTVETMDNPRWLARVEDFVPYAFDYFWHDDKRWWMISEVETDWLGLAYPMTWKKTEKE